MANYENEINSWPVLKNGLHYKWLVDYAAFSAFGTFELTAEEWEKRDLIVNFKGNSELTTEMDHQEALKKAIEMVSDKLKNLRKPRRYGVHLQNLLGEEAAQFTLVCIPAALEAHTKRRFKEFSEEICKATGMTNAYPAFSYTHDVDEDGDPVDELHIDEAFFQGKKIILFDDIIASGNSVAKFADQLEGYGAKVELALALGKKISDGYDQK